MATASAIRDVSDSWAGRLPSARIWTISSGSFLTGATPPLNAADVSMGTSGMDSGSGGSDGMTGSCSSGSFDSTRHSFLDARGRRHRAVDIPCATHAKPPRQGIPTSRDRQLPPACPRLRGIADAGHPFHASKAASDQAREVARKTPEDPVTSDRETAEWLWLAGVAREAVSPPDPSGGLASSVGQVCDRAAVRSGQRRDEAHR